MTTTTQKPTETATLWNADPAHSVIQFSVRHMMISEVTGRFREFQARLVQENPDFSGSRLEATVNTESISTESADRDNHLRSADFFDAAAYPHMIFQSTAFTKIGDDEYRIEGNLTIRGVTRPVVLNASYLGQAVDPWGNLRTAFKATTRINRYDFGLQWNQALETGGFLVGKEVEITLNVQFIKQS